MPSWTFWMRRGAGPGTPGGAADPLRGGGPHEPTEPDLRDRGRPLRADAYGWLLLIILVSLPLMASERSGAIGAGGQGFALLYGMAISGVSRRWWWAALAFTVGIVALTAVGLLVGHGRTEGLSGAAGMLLAVTTIFVILRRILSYGRITIATIFGLLSVYVLIGLSYGYLYLLSNALRQGGFFAEPGRGGLSDCMYFSLVTMCTVGYGDLTAAFALGRMIATTEALVGQLYMVTVVALSVANLGRPRDRRGGD